MNATPILSLDGGGSRALFYLQILKYIEKVTGKHSCDLFRLIAGTSAGGIVALALTCGKSYWDRADTLWASEVETLFLQLCPILFKPGPLQSLTALFRPKYDPAPLARALQQPLGLSKLSEAHTNILITTFCLDTFEPVYLTNVAPVSHPDYTLDWFAHDAALATSAGPTMFPAHQVGSQFYVDGGLLMNNPSLLALNVMKGHTNPLLLSLGSGIPKEGWPSIGGELDSIGKVLSICIDGAGKQAHEFCESILPEGQYLRAQMVMAEAQADQSTPEQLATLIMLGEQWVDQNKAALDVFIGKLLEANR